MTLYDINWPAANRELADTTALQGGEQWDDWDDPDETRPVPEWMRREHDRLPRVQSVKHGLVQPHRDPAGRGDATLAPLRLRGRPFCRHVLDDESRAAARHEPR